MYFNSTSTPSIVIVLSIYFSLITKSVVSQEWLEKKGEPHKGEYFDLNKEREIRDLKSFRLKGKVKLLESIQYTVENKFGEFSKGNTKEKYHWEFNDKGLETSIGEIYKYNNDNIIEKNTPQKNNNGGSLIRYKYDETGKLIEKNTYNSNGDPIVGKSTYKYSNNGREIEKRIYGTDGTILYNEVFKFDISGKLIEYKDNHTGKNGWVYKYDIKDNIIEERECSNKYVDGKMTYKCDIIWPYKYDEKGNNIEYKNDWGQLIKLIIKYKYDTQGNLLEQNSFSTKNPDNKISYKYEYDVNNNWIKKMVLKNDVVIEYFERIIEYYK